MKVEGEMEVVPLLGWAEHVLLEGAGRVISADLLVEANSVEALETSRCPRPMCQPLSQLRLSAKCLLTAVPTNARYPFDPHSVPDFDVGLFRPRP